jgi:hypothetical protein
MLYGLNSARLGFGNRAQTINQNPRAVQQMGGGEGNKL